MFSAGGLSRLAKDCLGSRRQKMALNAIQKRAYTSEAEENFRWLSSLLATKSTYVLTPSDLVDDVMHPQISEIGEYAEIAHGSISPSFVFQHLEELCQPGYPLEGYEALKRDGAQLVEQFSGNIAEEQGYVTFRPGAHQLIVAFSGTSSVAQTLKDIRSWRIAYPPDKKQSTVHVGFWEMYRGVRNRAFEALRKGFQEYSSDVKELVLTGHSMGGVMCYLLALDLMVEVGLERSLLPYGIVLNLTVFGSPRFGNEGLAKYWRRCIQDYRSRFGAEAFHEYSVKGYNDGAHSLPPYSLGFRHLTESPLYFYHGRLYRVPHSECDHGAFTVTGPATTADGKSKTSDVESVLPDLSSALGPQSAYVAWPRGGHNYYNDRDMEKFQRRMRWLGLDLHGEPGWQERYMAKVKAWEKKWSNETES